MGIENDQPAKDIARQMDGDKEGNRLDAVGQAMQKCFSEINAANANDPNVARAMRREFVKEVDDAEENGKGLDLTIKYDNTTKAPKHYTIMSADLNRHAASIAKKLDNNQQADAEAEYFQVVKDIKAAQPKPSLQKRDTERFILTIDAYEKDGPGERDDVKITYGPQNQPINSDIDFAPKPQDMVKDKNTVKKPPKDGETIPFDKLLSDYSTSFGDAYDRSKKAADDDPAKSKTLEETIDRIKRSPWPIQVKFDSKIERPEYNSATSTITLSPKELAPKQIEQFVHEGYHATHQSLGKLFLSDKGKLSREEYVSIKNGEETSAFEAEIKVHQELTSKMPGSSPVVYRYVDKDNKRTLEDLSTLYSNKGKDGLSTFLTQDAKTVMIINGKRQLGTYGDYWSSVYDSYANDANFNANSKLIRDKAKNDAAWRNGIEEGF